MPSPHEPHPQEKRSFFATFSLVLAALLALGLVLVLVARLLGGRAPPPDRQREMQAEMAARLAPVTRAITTDAELKQATAAVTASGPDRSALNGQQIVNQVCGACHNAGVLNAPKAHDNSQWAPRLQADGGIDGLVANAVRGKGAMPPKGGAPELSDQQIRQAIEIMLK